MFRSVAVCVCAVFFTGFQSFANFSSVNKTSLQQQKPKISTEKKDSLLKKAQEQLPKPKAEALKKPVLKKLADALKFRENARNNERDRILDLMKNDSIIASVPELKKLILDLSDALNKNMSEANKATAESSRAIAENKKEFNNLLDSIILINKRIQSREIAVPGPGGNKPYSVTKEADPNQQYINDLLGRLLPALTDTKEDEEKVKNRLKRLKLIRDIYAKKDKRDTIITKSDSNTAVKYVLKLGHKLGHNEMEVIGNYQYDLKYNASNYNFSILTALAYNSYDIDVSTGMAKNFNMWNDAPVITSAKEADSKVFLTVTTKDSRETADFLVNQKAMAKLISSTFDLLKFRHADGINIALTGLNQKLRSNFVEFISALSKSYRDRAKTAKPFHVLITLPVYDEAQAYDIVNLEPFVYKFIIDFSKKPTDFPGPLAPLNDESDYSIQSGVARYLNTGLPPSKFILGLSYYGVESTLDQETGIETFDGSYIPYKTIRSKYQYAPVTYNKEGAYAVVETKDDEGNTRGHIYFENETSLEQKYDFIIQSGLGGVAIWQLGADEGYGELWGALANKFVTIDTVSREVISLRTKTPLEYIKSNLVAYFYALQYPCDIKYDNLDTFLLSFLNVVLALVSIGIGVTLVLQIKAKGEKWKWKKTLMRVLIVCLNLFIITIFMWLYIDSAVPWFGGGEDNTKCINMPFVVLLAIILTGLVLGSLIMRFLIFPAMQRDEIP